MPLTEQLQSNDNEKSYHNPVGIQFTRIFIGREASYDWVCTEHCQVSTLTLGWRQGPEPCPPDGQGLQRTWSMIAAQKQVSEHLDLLIDTEPPTTRGSMAGYTSKQAMAHW